jgi:hypothetical protein
VRPPSLLPSFHPSLLHVSCSYTRFLSPLLPPSLLPSLRHATYRL